MSSFVDKQIAEAESKLVLLLREVKDTPVFDRAKLYVAKFSGGRALSDWIHDDSVPLKERATLAKALVEILLTKDYSRLPEVAEPAQQIPAAVPVVTPSQSQTPGQTAAPASPPPTPTPPASAEPERGEMPAPDELRAEIRRQVRHEFADLLERIAKVLRE